MVLIIELVVHVNARQMYHDKHGILKKGKKNEYIYTLAMHLQEAVYWRYGKHVVVGRIILKFFF